MKAHQLIMSLMHTQHNSFYGTKQTHDIGKMNIRYLMLTEMKYSVDILMKEIPYTKTL